MELGEEIDVYDTIADADSAVEEIVMTAIKNEMVRDLISCLNKKEYMIFKLHNVEGYKLIEISKEYNINYDTVRSIHSRTCKKLKRRGEKLFRKEGLI
ncbi:MAG: sigma-70 family RNA polymerase sigma factor [Acholeplasmatales bacterium]|nr:sigma-70 family RNA polymerase sigma factor [Acholeplasmatales bacterium]